MKYAIFLLIVFIAIVAWQNKYYSRRADDQYRLAIADLPDKPLEAYDKIKVTFKYSNLLSFGRVRKAQTDFFVVLRDKMIGRINSQDELQIGWIGAVGDTLAVFQTASADADLGGAVKAGLPGHQKAVFEALVGNKDQIVQTTGLASWDALVKGVVELENKGIITEQSFPGASDWIRGLHAVDRQDILWRETLKIAKNELDAGVVALGQSYSTETTGPLIAKLDKKVPDESLLEADLAFTRGTKACLKFAKTFGHNGDKDVMPPEVEAMWAKLTFNIGSMRVAHLIDYGPKVSRAVSYYMVKLYVTPGSDVMPGDSQIYESFINVVGDQLRQSSESFEHLGDTLGGDGPALVALAQWTLVGYGKTLGREQAAAAAVARFRDLRSKAGATESGGKLLADLDNSDYPFVIVR